MKTLVVLYFVVLNGGKEDDVFYHRYMPDMITCVSVLNTISDEIEKKNWHYTAMCQEEAFDANGNPVK